VFNLLRCLSNCLSLYKGSEDKKRKLDHYFRWIRKRASAIASNPIWMIRVTAGEEPTESEVERAIIALSHSGGWNGCSIVTFPRREFFYNLEMELLAHSEVVASVSWSHDGSKILSCSNSQDSRSTTIGIWDGVSGELLNTLEGHSPPVKSVSWNHDDSKIVSGSWDKTVKIWNAGNGELLNTLEGHSLSVNSVSWNHDGSKIVSGSEDKTIKIWDGRNGELLKSWKGHPNAWLTSVSWNHDSSKIVSGSSDKGRSRYGMEVMESY
jgi:WD40 repeat protein